MEQRKPVKRDLAGIALAGGGPLGGIWEVGALIALEEALQGLSLNDCDVFVGVSSGAFFASGLANGLSPRDMHARFIESHHDDPFKPEVLLRPAFGEYRKKLGALPQLFYSALSDYIHSGANRSFAESFQRLAKSVPNGIFDSTPIRRYLQRLAATPGQTDDFRELKAKLFIIATDLDASSLVMFGSPGFDHVPISRAVEASAALPGYFPPVEIDGRHYVDGALLRTLNASAALKENVKLLFAINPLVPHKTDIQTLQGTSKSLADDGLVNVLQQMFRALIHSRMKVGMERYRHAYPDADIILFEPRSDDREMFYTNVFSWADRRRLAEHAYQQTREDLRGRAGSLTPVLAKHGVSLDMACLEDRGRTLTPKAAETESGHPVLQRLSAALSRLEPILKKKERTA